MLNNIIKDLTPIAMSDRQITQEEKSLIDVIITDVQAYLKMKSEFDIEKHTSKKEKKELLAKQKDNILRHAYINLSNDQNNEDLTKILEKLHEIITTI